MSSKRFIMKPVHLAVAVFWVSFIMLLSTTLIPVRAQGVYSIERVSISSTGEQANEVSGSAAISADGQFVAFASSASNLASNDTNKSIDVFVHNRQTGQTMLVSVERIHTTAAVGDTKV